MAPAPTPLAQSTIRVAGFVFCNDIQYCITGTFDGDFNLAVW